MNEEPDYSQCSLTELRVIQQHTNAEKYPSRAAAIEREIQKRLCQPKTPKVGITSRYGGFWRRATALGIDGMLFMPVSLLFLWGPLTSWQLEVVFSILSAVICNGYVLVFHYMWGQTIGKMVVGVRVQMNNGKPVTLRAAVVRHLPVLLWSLLIEIAYFYALSQIPYNAFVTNTFLQQGQWLLEAWPFWGELVADLATVWIVVEVVTLLADSRRRSVHDYMGGTLVVRLVAGETAWSYRTAQFHNDTAAASPTSFANDVGG